jgi:cell division protein FtsA
LRSYVVEIIEARLEEIFRMVNNELKKIQRDGKLPAGIILTGGGSKLPGLAEFSKKALRLPVSLGKPQNVNTVIDRVMDPSFATATGLVLWGEKYASSSGRAELGSIVKNLMSNQNVAKIRKWFKSFLP